MNMIEAGAQAMFRLEDTEGEEWDSKHIMEDVRESYREAARACWTAMVEGLTDEQLAQVYKKTINVSGVEMALSGPHRQAAERLRAALLQLTEVGE